MKAVDCFIPLVFFGLGVILGCVSQEPEPAKALELPVTYSVLEDDVPEPPVPPDGLDPISTMLMREREERYEIEKRLRAVERLAAVQMRQIRQLQRICFGVGNKEPVAEPIDVPPELGMIGQEIPAAEVNGDEVDL